MKNFKKAKAVPLQCINDGPYWFTFYRNKTDKTATLLSSEQLQECIVKGNATGKQGENLVDITAEARHYHAQNNQAEYDRWKSKAPAVTPATRCHLDGGHRQQNIVSYTGLLMYDFDHLGSRDVAQQLVAQVRQLPYTFAAWISTGGEGVRLLVRYLPDTAATALLRETYGTVSLCTEDYKRIWLHGQSLVETATQLHVDPATKDPTRLSYLCHDAEAYFDLSPHGAHNSIAIGIAVLRPLPPAKAFATQKEEEGFTTDAHTLACRRLQQQGQAYAPGNRNNYLFVYACHMCRLGADEAECRQQAALMRPALGKREIAATVVGAYHAVQGRGEAGSLAQRLKSKAQITKDKYAEQQELVIAYATTRYDFRHNVRSGATEYCERDRLGHANPLMNPYRLLDSNGSLNDLWVECNRALGFDYPIHKLNSTLRSSAVCHPYDPIQAYLWDYCHHTVEQHYATLPQEVWHHNPYYLRDDGTAIATPWPEEEDEIMKFFGNIQSSLPRPLLLQAGAMWAVSMMATASDSRRKGHFMLILQGDGGPGKSNLLHSLAPQSAPGVHNLVTTIAPTELTSRGDRRGLEQKLCSSILGIVDEFSQLSPKEMANLKEILTSTQRGYRALYSENLRQTDRICTFAATTNEQILMNNEWAEKRRLVPLPVSGVKDNGLVAFDDTRFFGQAAWLLRAGMQYWLTPQKPSPFEEALFAHTEEHVTCSVEESMIHTYIYAADATPQDAVTGEILPLRLMSATEVLNEFAHRAPALARVMTVGSIGKAFAAQGYRQQRSNGRRGYRICFKSEQTIDAERLRAGAM